MRAELSEGGGEWCGQVEVPNVTTKRKRVRIVEDNTNLGPLLSATICDTCDIANVSVSRGLGRGADLRFKIGDCRLNGLDFGPAGCAQLNRQSAIGNPAQSCGLRSWGVHP
jgi:hypothetical protein